MKYLFKTSLKKAIAGLILLVVLFSNSAFAAFPEDEIAALKEQLSDQIGESDIGVCRETLVPLYDLEMLSFLEFLEANFQNKSSNSSLADLAIARYGQFKRALREHFDQLDANFDLTDAPDKIEQLDSYEACSVLTQSYLDLAKEQMIQHIKDTTASKKATVFSEKYRAINDRLKELHLEVAKMYGMLATFKQKLPGFVKQCLTN